MPNLNESGQGLTEYLILLILVAVVCIGAVTSLGKAIDGRLDAAKEKINGVSVNPERSRSSGRSSSEPSAEHSKSDAAEENGLESVANQAVDAAANAAIEFGGGLFQ